MFNFERKGYVYDTTTYNAYVQVVAYGGSSYCLGKYTGGYASDGNFYWVLSTYPSAYDILPSTITETAAKNYDSDITLHGFCVSYYPDNI